MMQYSLLDRRPEESCLGLLQEHDIGGIVRGAVAKGLLIDKSSKEYLGYSEEQVARVLKAVTGLSDQDRTAGQTALQFALRHSAVCTVAAGMRTEEQLMDNVGTAGATGLTKEEYQALRSVLTPNVYEAHR
jgi:aryl-alcohol dehydrogenase-like predicted oxidoreductase